MAKILLIYYSRTGITKKVAENLASILSAEAEEIFCLKNRAGVIGYLLSGKEAAQRRLAKIKPAVKNPADYDLTIIGTPIWSFNMTSPVRAYLHENKGKFNRVAFFCTMGGSGNERAFKEMAEISGLEPAALLALTTKEVIAGQYEDKLYKFVSQIK